MKKLGVKSSIFKIVGLVISLVFAFLMVSLFNFERSNEDLSIDAMDYITISNLSELQTFASNVNSGKYNSEGVYAFLLADVDCQGQTISIGTKTYPFKGTFMGGNFTISNFKIGYLYDYDPTSDYNTDVGGLFRHIQGASINNLRVYNFSDSGSSVKYRLSNVGGLVGAASGNNSIDNCIVDTFSSTNSSLVKSTSGIVASGRATISNCLVKNVTCANDFYAFGPGAWSNSATTKSSCKDSIYTGSASSKGFSHGGSNSLSHSQSGCYGSDEGDNFVKISSISATKDTEWYFAHDYSAWPMLTSFMSWKTVTINVVNGTADKNSIEIPKDATKTFSSSSNTILIYSQQVIASPTSAAYQCLGWTCNSATSYTCTFELNEFDIYFNLTSNVNAYYSVNGGSFTKITSYYSVKVTKTLEIEIEYGNYSKQNSYYECIFKLKNTAGQDVIVKYELSSNKYYIKNYIYKLNGSSTFIDGTIDKLKVYDEINYKKDFSVKLEKKTYSIQVGE